MIYHIYAENMGDKWLGKIECPGGQPNHPFSTELLYGPTSRKLEKSLLRAVKVALKQSDCTEVKVIVR